MWAVEAEMFEMGPVLVGFGVEMGAWQFLEASGKGFQ